MTDPGPAPAPADLHPLRVVVRELHAHAAEAGWDQPARLYALVDTAALLVAEPGLADALGLVAAPGPGADPEPGSLTSVEQDPVPPDTELEEVLARITWPADVDGAAVSVERLVLPPGAEEQLPDDAEQARAAAAEHPDRAEVRMTVAVLRDGRAWCAIRLRGHDEPADLLQSPDLVPALVGMLRETLAD